MSTTIRKAIKTTTTLAAAYVAGSGSMTLAPAGGNLIGAASTFLLVGPNGNTSAYSCSGVSGDTLTGVSLVEGTDEYFPAGSLVELAATTAAGGGGSGTVTSVSVVTANGYSGTVANPTTTPAITISGPAAGGTGTVTSVSVVTANGYSGTVANPTTTPAITISGPAGSAGLTPTATKTANYTAAAGDFVIVDATAGGVTVTLPAAPANGSQIAVKCANLTGGGVTISTSGADVFDRPGSMTSFTLPLNDETIWLQYRSSGAIWFRLSDSTPLTQLNTVFIPVGKTTAWNITQHYGSIIVPSGTSGTITMDLSLGDWQIPAACTGAFTLALSNPTVGQQFTVVLTQAASGGPYAVTWFGGITWMGSPYTAPTMPTTASARLSATFKCVSAGVYLGWWLGNSAA